MRFLNRIIDHPHQRFFLTGNANQRIAMTLRFLPLVESWVIDIEYEDFRLYGVRVVNSVNFLRQYRNIIPFGMSCQSRDNLDPVFINDFSSQRTALHLLDSEDVQRIEAGIFE